MKKLTIMVIIFIAVSLFLSCDKGDDSRSETCIVKKIVQGDIMCYIDLQTTRGTIIHRGAVFDICEKKDEYLGKKVKIVETKMVSVNDCESNEPCGKTRKEKLITKLMAVK